MKQRTKKKAIKTWVRLVTKFFNEPYSKRTFKAMQRQEKLTNLKGQM